MKTLERWNENNRKTLMETVSSLSMLLKIAKVVKFTIETLPKILQTITENKIRLDGEALNAMTSLLKSSPDAMTIAYEKIQSSLQKAYADTDKLSLYYIKELLNSFKAAGISDKRISKLLDKILQQEHEVRLERTKGSNKIATTVIWGVIAIIISVITKKPPPKFPFWYK
jgi:Glu-tRNA(Gln) amidotransferase subunit E-like FAD-binding protein